MFFGKKLIFIFSLIILITGLSGTAQPRSLYVITDVRESTVKAYDIKDDKIEYQATVQGLPVHGSGAVGLALDPDSETLFVTHDGSNKIELINAKTMTEEKCIPTTDELAGIVFDKSNQRILAVSREDDKLYVYLWDPVTKSLTLEGGTYKTLTNLPYPYAYGIGLDEITSCLYVTNSTKTVYLYDINTQTLAIKELSILRSTLKIVKQ